MLLERYLEGIKFTKGIPEIIAFGAGAYKGYCDSQGILMPSEVIDASLKYAPTFIHAEIGGYLGLVKEIIDKDNTSYLASVIKGGFVGAVVGAIETGLGYSIGYTVGNLSK